MNTLLLPEHTLPPLFNEDAIKTLECGGTVLISMYGVDITVLKLSNMDVYVIHTGITGVSDTVSTPSRHTSIAATEEEINRIHTAVKESDIEVLSEYLNPIQITQMWHRKALPQPDLDSIRVSIGVHLEEVAEWLELLGEQELQQSVSQLASTYKNGGVDMNVMKSKLLDKENLANFVSETLDQIFTGIGVLYRMNPTNDASQMVNRLNRGNFSKFVDGSPVFHDNGKVSKGPNFKRESFADWGESSYKHINILINGVSHVE